MAFDFYNLTDKQLMDCLFVLEDDAARHELDEILSPAREMWGDIISLGIDSLILTSQMDYLLALIDEHPNRQRHIKFYRFLGQCREEGIDLQVSAD